MLQRLATPRTALRFLLPVLAVLVSCKKPTEAPVASRLAVVQGNLQVAAVGTVLGTPVILRVLGTDGAPIPKIPVSFSVLAGGGVVEPGTVTSDANGEVKVKWTLGSLGSVQTLSAGAPGVDPVNMSATGVLPTDLIVAQGNNQFAKAANALPVPLVIRVTGGNNVPIPGVTVALSITSGGGSISPQSAVTNALGEVSVRWTLGPQTGQQTANVTAGVLGPISISAVAN